MLNIIPSLRRPPKVEDYLQIPLLGYVYVSVVSTHGMYWEIHCCRVIRGVIKKKEQRRWNADAKGQ